MTAGRRDPDPLDVPDDEALLRAHVAGDPDAFAELFRRHRDRLWAVAMRTVGDREDAADALQEALLSAHRAAPRFRGDSAVTTWLHRIVVNCCLDRIRRRQAHPTVPLPDGNADPDRPTGVEPAAPATDHDTALVVRQALARLPEDQRAALVLVDVQGYPVAEAAVLLGVAEGTVKSRCSRGRARLALLLGHLRPGTAGAGVRSATARNRPPGDDVRSVTDNSGEGVS
ncbi:RNA polymerase sigma factor SigM [Asanoa sp. NPDC050611]|uniref:RNA polymerase sigma factor SigM n=1 Tax=Asanoa sp. NPDC050611 TaxID=3157098 RepID=UPI0033C1C364